MDWVTIVSYDWSMVAFESHRLIIAHILYLNHPSNGKVKSPYKPSVAHQARANILVSVVSSD